jgi:hypothetical protein
LYVNAYESHTIFGVGPVKPLNIIKAVGGKMGCAAPHPFHWDDLRNRPKELVLRQPGVTESEDKSAFVVSFLNALYLVELGVERIREISPNPVRVPSQEFQILLIRYLVADYGGPEDNVVVSEKDLPGGVTFFQGPHAMPVAAIAKIYGSNLEAFEKLAREFGAVPVSFGDLAMKFYPFPEIPVTYVIWREDEEFPASVSVLFDKSITRWFTLDMVFTTVLVLTDRLAQGALIQ